MYQIPPECELTLIYVSGWRWLNDIGRKMTLLFFHHLRHIYLLESHNIQYTISEFIETWEKPQLNQLKGAVPRDFRLQVFSWINFPKPLSIQGRFKFFVKIRGDICSSRWKKSSIRKVLIIFLGHFWVVEFTLRYQPPVSTTPAEPLTKFVAGVFDTGGKFATVVFDTDGAPSLANVSAKFQQNSKCP